MCYKPSFEFPAKYLRHTQIVWYFRFSTSLCISHSLSFFLFFSPPFVSHSTTANGKRHRDRERDMKRKSRKNCYYCEQERSLRCHVLHSTNEFCLQFFFFLFQIRVVIMQLVALPGVVMRMHFVNKM